MAQDSIQTSPLLIWLENWVRDGRQSWRGLRKRPVFAFTAIASLAIGIGAVTSIYSVLDAVVWKPVALPGEQDLYVIREFKKGEAAGSNGPRLRDWQKLSSFAGVSGAYGEESTVWKGPRGAEALSCLRVFTGAMQVFRPSLALGRAFTADEESRAEPVALLAHGFWRNRFSGDPKALGQTMVLGATSYVIIGVLAPSVGYPGDVDVWTPAPLELQNGSRAAGYLGIVARAQPGASQTAAQSELNAMAQRLQAAYPETDAGLQGSLMPLREWIARDARTPLLVLFSVVACVLLMICVNIAALLLARVGERQAEAALRSALGAGTASLMRLYLSETLFVAVAGGMAGILLAVYGVDFLKAILPAGTPRLTDATIDWRVLLFAAGLSTLGGLV